MNRLKPVKSGLNQIRNQICNNLSQIGKNSVLCNNYVIIKVQCLSDQIEKMTNPLRPVVVLRTEPYWPYRRTGVRSFPYKRSGRYFLNQLIFVRSSILTRSSLN